MNQIELEIKQWIHLANIDLKSAGKLMSVVENEEGVICFEIQQSIEKFLKAFLLYNNIGIEKTHDLTLLQKEASKLNSSFEIFNFKKITECAVVHRYPTNLINPTLNEVLNYLKTAKDVQTLVLSLVKID